MFSYVEFSAGFLLFRGIISMTQCTYRMWAWCVDLSVCRFAGISFTPREIGDHWVSVFRNGQPIPGSPFKVVVSQNEIGNASKVKVGGRALTQGMANELNEFFINTREAGPLSLSSEFHLIIIIIISSSSSSSMRWASLWHSVACCWRLYTKFVVKWFLKHF